MSLTQDDYEQLKQLLNRFFVGGESALQAQLFELQKSPLAWQWSSLLLQQETDSLQLRFFAASTVGVKISRDFDSLLENDVLPLKTSLLDWLAASARIAYPQNGTGASNERVVLRKLAVAVCLLFMHLLRMTRGQVSNLSMKLHPENRWPNWMLEVMTYLSAASSSGPAPSREAIFEVLTILVEQGSITHFTGKERVSYDKSIYENASFVASGIAAAIAPDPQPSASMLVAAFKCCQSWVNAGQMPSAELSSLYPLLLLHLTQSSVGGFEDVTVAVGACLEEWISSCSEFFTSTNLDQLLDILASQWTTNHIEYARREMYVPDNALAVFKLLVSVIEFAPTTIVKSLDSPRSMAILNNLLLITSLPGQFPSDEQHSDVTFTTWGLIQEAMADEGCIGSDPTNQKQVVGKQLFDALINALLLKVVRSDELRSEPKDVRDRFMNYRRDAGDVLLNAYYVLRDDMLETLIGWAKSSLSSQVGNAVRCVAFLSPNLSRPKHIEAVLFCLKSIAEGIPREESDGLLQIVNSDFLAALPQDRSIQHMTLVLIDELAEWIRHHSAAVLPAVHYIVANLQNENLSQPAARALQQLCDACRSELTPYVNEFAGLVHSLAGRIDGDDYVKIIASVSAVLQALPVEQALDPMLSLCEKPVLGLQEVASYAGPELPKELVELCTLHMSCLTACADGFARPDQEELDLDDLVEANESNESNGVNGDSVDYFSHDPRVIRLRTMLLQSLQAIAEKYGNHASLAITFTDLLKELTISANANPLYLNPIDVFQLVVVAMRRGDMSLWLHTSLSLPQRIMSRIKDPLQLANFNQALLDLCQYVLAASASLEKLNADPDVVQNFMNFLVEIFRHAMRQLASNPSALQSIYRYISLALQMQERVSLQRSALAMSLLVHDSTADVDYGPVLKSLVLSEGAATIKILLFAIASSAPRSSVSSLAEALHAFVTKYPVQTRLWMTEVFAELGFPSARLTEEEEQRFLKVAMATRTLKKMRMVAEDFALKGRGLVGTAF